MDDEMVMGRGVERKANPNIERMLNVFDLHFSTPAAMSRICAFKTERNLQIFGWCLQFKQSCPWATLSYFCLRNKAGKINAMGRVVLKGPKHEIFEIVFFTQIRPVRVGDLGTGEKK
jgi:hypothetical protein